MPFLAATMSSNLYAAMLSNGLVGSSAIDLCNVVGDACQMAVVGKMFSTIDTGTIPASGVSSGKGVGIILSKGLIKSAILSKGISQGFLGVDFNKLADSAATAFVNSMALVDLTSTHIPVFLGVGNIVAGSITISGGEITNNMIVMAKTRGLLGSYFDKFANAVGFGFGEGIKVGTGTVTITGSPGSNPAPGSGKSITGVIT